SASWVLPTRHFHITEWFGARGPSWATGYHTGIDFATSCGTPVVAIDNGAISDEGYDIGGWAYGNQIRLRLSNGDQVWYNHLSAIQTTTGAHVVEGQQLGQVGETGNAYGCHLHFEYRLAADLDTAVDPAPFFAAHGRALH
ncbi:MAG: M23 family metallopeptidase, partial [Nocardioidaceae bacterium]